MYLFVVIAYLPFVVGLVAAYYLLIFIIDTLIIIVYIIFIIILINLSLKVLVHLTRSWTVRGEAGQVLYLADLADLARLPDVT